MKNENIHFTTAEIIERIHPLHGMNNGVANFGIEPSTQDLEALLEPIVGTVILCPGMVGWLIKNRIEGDAFRVSDGDNGRSIWAMDLWLETQDLSLVQAACAGAAQSAHRIAANWRQGQDAGDAIARLEAALYKLTALQLEVGQSHQGDHQLARSLILCGGYQFGTEAFVAEAKFLCDPENNVQVGIPYGMSWNAAVANLKKVLADFEFMINTKFDTTVEALELPDSNLPQV